MRKLTILLFTALLMFSCSKESTEPSDENIADKLTFNITPKYPGTKGVKQGWESGDAVYVFFEGVTTGYLKLTFNGSVWSGSFKGTISASDLSASGKKLAAVYLPYGIDINPSFDGTYWVPDKHYATWYLCDDEVPYTFDSGLNSITATMDMTNSEGYVQFFVPDPEASGTADVFCTGIHKLYLGQITTSATIYSDGYYRFNDFTAYAATVNGDKGWYFSGKVPDYDPTTDYLITLKKGNTTYMFFKRLSSAPASQSAIKLPALTSGKWIEAGEGKSVLINGVEWATTNVGTSNPLDKGSVLSWKTTEENWHSAGVPNVWRVPSVANFESLLSGTDIYWLDLGAEKDLNDLEIKSGYLFVDSNDNGKFIFLTSSDQDYSYHPYGEYWTSEYKEWQSSSSSYLCYYLNFYENDVSNIQINWCSQDYQFPVRCIKE